MQQYGPPKKGGSFLLGRDFAANIDCGSEELLRNQESRYSHKHIVTSTYVYKGSCIYVTSTNIDINDVH